MTIMTPRTGRFRFLLPAVATALVTFALIGPGCIQPGSTADRYDPIAEGQPEQGLHGIDPQRLHYIMAKLGELHLDRIPPDELDDPQPDPDLIRAAGMGEAMVADAKSLPGIVGKDMSRAELWTLKRHASAYASAARELVKADSRQDVPRVRRALYSVTKSCNECHVAIAGPHFAFDDGPDAASDPRQRKAPRSPGPEFDVSPADDDPPSGPTPPASGRPTPERGRVPDIDDDI